MKKLFLIIFVLSLIFISCDLFTSGTFEQRGNFWAFNFRNNRAYKVDAELLYQGVYCNVWVEKKSGAGAEQARLIANEYDNNIYNKMIENFSMRNFNYNGFSFDNIMDFADWLGDNDRKLCILLLDIRDNYKKGVNDSYIAGYFWSGDLVFSTSGIFGSSSNERDMIYIDTNPGMENGLVEEAYRTLAHEMQHLMNFVTSVLTRYEDINNSRYVYSMDTWIDEGLSSAAEWVYSGRHSQSRIDWFNLNGMGDYRKGLIDQGNNFFVWGNRENESSYAVLDDYATVYLFFQWLRLQAGSDIYKKIISSSYIDHEAVTIVLDETLPGRGYSKWDVVLKTWLAANYINAPDGAYGYRNDPALVDVRIPAPSSINKTLLLAPGEGVYSLANTNPNPVGQGANIRFAYLANNVLADFYNMPSVMLTYNINSYFNPETYNKGARETGITTGIPIPPSSVVFSGGRSAASADSGPYRIDAGDLLRQNFQWIMSNEQ